VSDRDLRDGLRGLAAPKPAPPAARTMVIAELSRRRRRRTVVTSGAASVLAAAGVIASFWVAGGNTPRQDPAPLALQEQVEQGAAPRTADWRALAPSPLNPRHGSVGVWTGQEMLVVGGSFGQPCPPTADCAVVSGTDLVDGAAYEPTTDTWRMLADAPGPVTDGLAAWSGSEMVVLTQRHTFAYDPEADTWRSLDAPPSTAFTHSVVTDAGIVFGSYDQVPSREAASDWLLNPVDGTWEPLPDDPFGESYDRSLAWDGERLWLLSMSVDHHFEAYEGASSRVAVLEDGEWRLVSEQTPPVQQGQRWWWFQDRLLAPASPYDRGSDHGVVLNPTSGEWTRVPATEAGHLEGDLGWVSAGCPLPPVGPGDHWVAGGGPILTSADPLVSTLVPGCEQLAQPDVAVWTGDELVVWGGVAPDYRTNVDVGLRWRPPLPGSDSP
jgi:hypothetical protein